jgi:hypothetical protein
MSGDLPGRMCLGRTRHHSRANPPTGGWSPHPNKRLTPIRASPKPAAPYPGTPASPDLRHLLRRSPEVGGPAFGGCPWRPGPARYRTRESDIATGPPRGGRIGTSMMPGRPRGCTFPDACCRRFAIEGRRLQGSARTLLEWARAACSRTREVGHRVVCSGSATANESPASTSPSGGRALGTRRCYGRQARLDACHRHWAPTADGSLWTTRNLF